jgi:hypothetical protein
MTTILDEARLREVIDLFNRDDGSDHRLIHKSWLGLAALGLIELVERRAAAPPSSPSERDAALEEIECPECGRHVMKFPQPATGFVGTCGRRLTRDDELRHGGCDALKASRSDTVGPEAGE